MAACTAAFASTMPVPQMLVLHVELVGNGLVLEVSTERSCAAVRFGATPSTSEATPATIGAEKLVPNSALNVSAPGVVAPVFQRTTVCAPPGADKAIPAPALLNGASEPPLVVAATAIAWGQFAGAVFATSPPPLPAAPTIALVTPCESAAAKTLM